MKMKTKNSEAAARRHLRFLSAASILLAIPVLSACYVAVQEPAHEVDVSAPREDLYVTEAPPPLQREVVVGVAPSPDYVWVDGYWTRSRGGWYWVNGRWAARPRHNAAWVQGRWDHRPGGYVWVGGRWH